LTLSHSLNTYKGIMMFLGSGSFVEWLIFGVIIIIFLAIDLLVFNKKAHKTSVKEAGIWSIVWIVLSLVFNYYVYRKHGHDLATQFFTAYIVEKALSVDNLFVFLAIFNYFRIADKYQHRILFWGILVAIVMRAVFIFAGTAIVHQFQWVMYIFGAFLVYTGIKFAFADTEEMDIGKNPVYVFANRHFKIINLPDKQDFFTRIDGKTYMTLAFLVLCIINIMDIVFALDSVPAVLAISTDIFIVYTSNIFAILGLRALYFVLVGAVLQFKYLNYGLTGILVFIGAKMLAVDFVHISATQSLLVIAAILSITIIASVAKR
jgi:tellurite resistance protein TerC